MLGYKQRPLYFSPIETGGLLQFVAQQLLPPAETPNPIILSENDVVEPPLPPIAKITPAGNESTTDRSILSCGWHFDMLLPHHSP